MDRETILQRLRAHEPELKTFGVVHLSLVGSAARGEARPGSDVDLAAELDPRRRVGLFRFAAMRERLEALLGIPVDLIAEPIEREALAERIERDRVRVF
jgi:predicted nucleotidyltransferase